MPRAFSPSSTALLDSLGRRNRTHADRNCTHCKAVFRPLRADSKYCSRPCMWANNGKQQKRKPEVWWVDAKGYIQGRVTVDGVTKRVKKHRLIMEQFLGRALLSTEDVHHINGIKTDNNISNLQVVDHGAHSREHNLSRTYKRGYKLALTDAERTRRGEQRKQMHAKARGNQP